MLAVLAALVQLGGSSAAPGDPPDVIGDWSAPFAWPIVAVHMSLTSTGEVFSLDGFDAALELRAALEPARPASSARFRTGATSSAAGHVQLADGRTLIVGGHIAAYEGLADTTLFNADRRTRTSAAPTWPSRAGTRRRRSCRTGGCSPSPATASSRTGPACRHAFADASVNSLPEVYNPKTNTWTSLTERPADVAALPAHVRALGRPGLRRRPGHDDAHPDPGTWTWSTVGTSPFDGHSAVMYRPNKIMKSGTWADPDFQRVARLRRRRPHRRDRHERADARLARDGADGARALVPQPDAAPRRHGARERRQLALGRRRPDEVGPAGRDLEPGHGDVDDGRRRSRTAACTTRRRCCCRTAAC